MAVGSGFVEINFTLDGVDSITQSYATWGRAIEDLTPAWQQIADDLRADFMLNMIAEGNLFGRWPSLADSTVAERLRQGFSAGPILYRTGTLAESLAYTSAPGNVQLVTPTSLTVGTVLPYAMFHQSGTRKMPMRKIVGLTRDRRAAVVKRIGDYIRDQARRAGIAMGWGL